METELATFINEEIKRRGWSYREVSRRAKVSHTTVINIVSGSVEPTPVVCRGLARAFGIPEERVYALAGILPEVGEIGPEVKDWNRRLRELTPDDRRRTIQAMDSVLVLAEQLGEYRLRPSPTDAQE